MYRTITSSLGEPRDLGLGVADFHDTSVERPRGKHLEPALGQPVGEIGRQ